MNTIIFFLIDLVAGAILQFLFKRHLDNKKHQRDLRAMAYADYLQCIAFTDMVTAMRQDTFGISSVAQADLEAVLLGERRAK